MTAPRAILFDFGGVLVEVRKRDAGYRELAQEIHDLIERSSGTVLEKERIEADMRKAAQRYSVWKNEQYRLEKPAEITHREFWEDYVASGWSVEARSAVVAHAAPLCERFEEVTMDREPLPGAEELLKLLAERQIRTACVSNALAGACSRRLVRSYGFEQLLGIQIYSDEIGIRKPNPDILVLALRSLGVHPQEAWYIGDKLDRDILTARRAGLSRAILMLSEETYASPPPVKVEPDLVVQNPRELTELVEKASQP
jgi:HAD superfamily hydrolase (TIGR01549 family)